MSKKSRPSMVRGQFVFQSGDNTRRGLIGGLGASSNQKGEINGISKMIFS